MWDDQPGPRKSEFPHHFSHPKFRVAPSTILPYAVPVNDVTNEHFGVLMQFVRLPDSRADHSFAVYVPCP